MSRSAIHNLVAATFARLGKGLTAEVWETLLVEDGCFVCYKFYCEENYAIWRPGWTEVEFYDQGGKLLQRVVAREPMRRCKAS
jgi:hypothetical protein